ncbi:MAG TPA: DASS family sodium-coupled anion symporter [Kiritimatiellia bacterium]|nr:DASS family sodium-coupled anion symporter [Kiritimatiellia bacterium]
MVKIWSPKASQGSTGPFLVRHHYTVLLLAVVLAVFTGFGPRPEGLSVEGQRVMGVFVLCAILWVTGVIPLQITSILAIVLLPALNIMSRPEAFALFGNSAVFFILGAFILSAALIDSGLSLRLSCLALERFTKSAKQLRNSILLISAFASFWMSEHAVAAMLFPVVMSLVMAFGLQPRQSRFGQSFFFALAWGCVIGGIATYLGGARNPLAAGILFAKEGIQISFMRLLAASFPIVVIMLGLALVVLNKFFPEEAVDVEKAREQLRNEREKIGPLSFREKGIGAISLGTIVAWIFLHNFFGLATIALFSVALLFMFRLVNWAEIESNVNWGIILMYGGAIALGSALHSSGASTWIVNETLAGTELTPLQLLILLGVLSLLLTEFISNVAVVSVMMPIGLGLASAHGLSPEAVTLAIALPSGLSYVMPMGTPATAIAYSSGFMSQREFFTYGTLMNALSLGAFALVAWLYWPLIGLK